MKIKELRLGNLLLRNGWTETVSRLSTTRINKNIASEYQGIPLTKEFLINNGFRDDTYGNFSIQIQEYCYLVLSIEGKAELREVINIADHSFSLNCEYVHQLQNLYFSLAGKELI